MFSRTIPAWGKVHEAEWFSLAILAMEVNLVSAALIVTANPEMALPVILKKHDGVDFFSKFLGQNLPFVILNQKL